MKTGSRGTFVISWSQTEIDGLIGAPVSAMAVGTTWNWRGQAVRIDDPRDILILHNSKDVKDLHQRAAKQVRRLLGDPDILRIQGDDPDTEENLFECGFELTDGRNRYEATIIETGDSQHRMLLFVDELPPSGQDLWVIAKNTERVTVQGLENSGGVVCFVPGTEIETPNGLLLVEDLFQGDLIATKDNGAQQVQWIGRRKISGARLAAMPHLRPVRIKANFFGEGAPEPDLVVSPDHRILLQGNAARDLFNETEVLVTARDLVNDQTVPIEHACRELSYIHVMLDDHQIIRANGVECGSFHPASAGLDHLDVTQLGQLDQAFPGLAEDPMLYGGFARRNLTQAEAAIMAYSHSPKH